MVLGNLGKRVSGPVRVGGGEVAREVHATAKEVMKGLRLGGLTEDGLSYKEKFVIRCYEVGINKTATIETIANLLQVFLFSIFYVMLCFDLTAINIHFPELPGKCDKVLNVWM